MPVDGISFADGIVEVKGASGATFSGTTTFTGPVNLPDGSLGDLALRFTSDPDNGIYYVTSNTWDLVGSGAISLRITSTGPRLLNGTAANPSISYISENTQGFYRIGAGATGYTSSGALITTFDGSGLLSKGLALSRQTTNTNATLTNGSYKCYVDTSTLPVTITLPTAPRDGQTVVIKKITTDVNAMVINPNGANLEGTSANISTVLTTRPSYQLGFATGTGWWIE